ncbi:MAG: replicative DNA helicase [Candidatus Spechtbacterales bacterium]
MPNSSKNDRLPPQDIDAEMSVLGSILMDKDSLFKVADLLNSSDFYLNTHGVIYETMLELSEKGQPLDILSVSSKLKEKKKLDDIGGKSALTKLVNSVPSAMHVAHYADLVHKKSLLRKMIQASYDIGQLGYREDEDVDVLLDEAEKQVFQISQRINSQSFYPLKHNLEEAFERIDNLHKNSGIMRGVPTGFTDLDNYLAGLQKSDLVILAARPSLGKSALAMDIVRHVAVEQKVPVGVFSLEMSRDQVVDRLIASEAGVDLWRLRTGKLSSKGEHNDFTKIQNALGSLSEAPVYIDDGLVSSVLQMRAMARRLQAERGLGLLVVDYLQLIQPRSISDNMVQQITEISRSLKSLARELNVPVLALSQLSRAVEQRPDRTPKLSDLRDSGSIEQDADVVLFISRDVRNEEDNIAEIHIAKHRNGPTGKVELFFDRKAASFKNLDKKLYANYTPPPMPDSEDEIDVGDIPS